MDTKILNLDEVAVTQFSVKLKGEVYAYKPPTVEDWIENTKAVEDARKMSGSIQDEVDLIINMMLRAFPTMTRPVLLGLNLPQLQKLQELVKKLGDSNVEADAQAQTNPPAASEASTSASSSAA